MSIQFDLAKQIIAETCPNRKLKLENIRLFKMPFGIGRNEMTAEEVANSLNLTRERVRQIKERALRRLREAENINILIKYLG